MIKQRKKSFITTTFAQLSQIEVIVEQQPILLSVFSLMMTFY